MADYIKAIRTDEGDKKIDYKSLGNLPTVKTTIDETATDEEIPTAKATWKAVDDAVTYMSSQISNVEEGLTSQINQIQGDIGDIDTALDGIIAIQNKLIGGGTV